MHNPGEKRAKNRGGGHSLSGGVTFGDPINYAVGANWSQRGSWTLIFIVV